MLNLGNLQISPEQYSKKQSYIPQETILNTILKSLHFLANFIPADLHLHQIVDSENLKTIGEARPIVQPSFYRRSYIGFNFSIFDRTYLYEAYTKRQIVKGIDGEIFNCLPLHQTAYPIFDNNGEIISLLEVERNLNEELRLGDKQDLYRSVINEIIITIITSALYETRSLPPIVQGDAVLIVDYQGIIIYSTYHATNIAKHIGITIDLEGNLFNDCFDRGSWLVHEVNPLFSEQELFFDKSILTIRSIPLKSYVVLILHDITALKHKDQEIQVKSAIIREVHHRVKNSLQAIAGLLRLQQRRSQSEKVKEILGESINRINSISLVHEYLSQKDVEVVNLKELSENILSATLQSLIEPDKKINTSIICPDQLSVPSAQATSIALILNELIHNALEHAFLDKNIGNLNITFEIEENLLLINVCDDGKGLPAKFLPEKHGHLGWYIIQTLIKDDLGGTFEIQSSKKGTKIITKVPYKVPYINS